MPLHARSAPTAQVLFLPLSACQRLTCRAGSLLLVRKEKAHFLKVGVRHGLQLPDRLPGQRLHIPVHIGEGAQLLPQQQFPDLASNSFQPPHPSNGISLEVEQDKVHLPQNPLMCFKSGLQAHLVVSLSW